MIWGSGRIINIVTDDGLMHRHEVINWEIWIWNNVTARIGKFLINKDFPPKKNKINICMRNFQESVESNGLNLIKTFLAEKAELCVKKFNNVILA